MRISPNGDGTLTIVLHPGQEVQLVSENSADTLQLLPGHNNARNPVLYVTAPKDAT